MTAAQAIAPQTNFSAGEHSPALRVRRDLDRNAAAVARMENMAALAEGIAIRRSGTQFVLPVRTEAELGKFLRFKYSVTDAYAIVANGGFVRFFKDGGYVKSGDDPYELAVPYLEADLPLLSYAPSGNALYIVGGVQPTAGLPGSGKRPQVLRRVTNNSWNITDYAPSPGPVDPQNLDAAKTVKASAVTGAITLTASAAGIITADDIGTVWRLDEPDLDAVALWKSAETGLSQHDQRRWNGNVYEVKAAGAGQAAGASPPVHTLGSVLSGAGKVTWTFLHKGYGFAQITSLNAGNVWNATVTARLPDSVAAVAGTYRYWPAAWSAGKGWPDKVFIHQDRLIFYRGDQWWMTKIDNFDSFEVGVDDDDAIPGRFRSPDGSAVQVEWAAASGVLVIGMRDSEWLLRASNSADALTPLDNNAIPDGSEGSAPHTPAIVDGGAVFIGRNRRRLHFIQFDRLAERLTVDEITLPARHILKGRAKAIAFQRDPHRILWVACENGDLIGFTFLPKMAILAAHRHPLRNGAVEDLIVVPGLNGESDDVYLLVRRTIANQTRRYIERLMPFFEAADDEAPDATGAWFVDCALRVDSPTPVSLLAGLDHLEGQEVAINADDGERPNGIVTDGALSIDPPAMSVLVGLPIDWRLKRLPIEIATDKGISAGMKKEAKEIVLDLCEAAGGYVRANGGTPEAISKTGDADPGAPAKLTTGPVTVTVECAIDDELTIEVFGSGTMPFSLAGVTPSPVTATGG